MKNIFKLNLLIPLLIIFFLGTESYSQSVEILNIDPTGYPWMKAEVKVKNAKGDDIRYPAYKDLVVTEQGKVMTDSIYCSPPEKTKFSIILTIDISNSMKEFIPGSTTKRRIDLVKEVALNVIKALPETSRWECAITTFDNWCEVNQMFTNDRELLKKAINNDSVNPRGGTDYNSGFLYDIRVPRREGGLLVARKAKYKPIMFFLTDGQHNGPPAPPPSRTAVWVNEIVKEAMDVNNKNSKAPVTIFALTLGLPVSQELKDLTRGTPFGDYFESSLNFDELDALLRTLIDKAGTLGNQPPCEVLWKTDCNGGGLVQVQVPEFSVNDTMSYVIPDAVKPFLSVTPGNLYFPTVQPNQTATANVTIKALKNYVLFNNPGFKSANAKFKVIDWGTPPVSWPMMLKKDSSRTIKIQYQPTDSTFSLSAIDFLSTACTFDPLSAYGGWVFSDPYHCGTQKINTPRDVDNIVFCNKTGQPIQVKNVKISGANANNFKFVSPSGAFTLNHDSCVSFKITFTPDAIGLRTGEYEVETNLGTFKALIDGTGSGNPEITLDYKTFPNANCKLPATDLVVDVLNSGARDLVLESATITGPDQNDFVAPNVIGITILPGEKKPVTVQFQPKGSAGLKNATMTIKSNAGAKPLMDMPLEAKKDSISFITSIQKLDFGIICPNENKTLKLQITNSGDVSNTINATETAPYALPVKSWTLTPGEQKEVSVVLQTAAEGTYNFSISFTDECSKVSTIQLEGKVEIPRLNKVNVNLITTVGTAKDTTFKLCNTTSSEIVVSEAKSNDGTFTINSPATPWTIQPGACIDVKVTYLPKTSDVIKSTISLKGTPCSLSDSITLFGNPSMATADLVTNDTEGFVGQNIPVPVIMAKPYKVAESGATTLATELNYDPAVLQYVSTVPPVTANANNGKLSLSGVSLNGGNAGTLVTVNFTALPTNKTSSPLKLENSTSVGGTVVFNEISGTFTLKPSTAIIEIGKCSASAGQEFTCPILLKDINNITNFNVSISTELVFDATLLEPLDKNIEDKGISGGLRTIKYLNLPVTPASGGVLFSPRFRAMLGSSKNSQLKLSNTQVATGQAFFTETAGEFELLNVCENGGTRLFDPFGNAVMLTATPNPGDDNVNIIYSTVEEGFTQIILTDVLGSEKITIVSGNLKAGVYDKYIDVSNLPNGKYLIIMTSQGKTLSKWLDIIR